MTTHEMKFTYLPRIIICPQPSISDPAGLISFMIPNVGMFSGNRVTRLLIRMLLWSIRRDLKTEYIHANNIEIERELNRRLK
jgi:hypothetical protein